MKAKNLMPVHIKQHLASLGCLASIEAADNDTWQLGCKFQTVSSATSVWKLNQSLACAVPLAFSAVRIILCKSCCSATKIFSYMVFSHHLVQVKQSWTSSVA
jgi:hypothetical protein